MGRGEVVGLYYREQKHICGKDYDTAPYMEVDLYPVSAKKHKASRRAKKKEASSLAQQTYNDNRAKRYHVQLVNANFGKGDSSAGAGGHTQGRPGFYELHQAALPVVRQERSAAPQVGGGDGVHHDHRGRESLWPPSSPRDHPAHGGLDQGCVGRTVERKREKNRLDARGIPGC